jgi:hypothetical protein
LLAREDPEFMIQAPAEPIKLRYRRGSLTGGPERDQQARECRLVEGLSGAEIAQVR